MSVQRVFAEGAADSSVTLKRIEAQSEGVGDTSENTINDLLAGYLRDHGLNITTQPSSRTPKRHITPDFELRNGAIIYGEGEWNASYVKGYDQAIEFGDIPGASGYFLIGYPEELKERVRQRRIANASPALLLAGVTFRGMFKLKDEPTSLFRGTLEEIPEWLKQSLSKQGRPPDATEFVHLMRDLVRDLTDFLPSEGSFPSLFEHIIASIPKGKGEIETARRAAAYLLLNQVVFYRILQPRGYPSLEPDRVKKPSDLRKLYFEEVLKDDYQAIFAFDVASLFPKDATQYIRDMLRIVGELQPEQFTRDLLGNIFHALIPLDVRKPVAAYYTNPMAARLLARLAIEGGNDEVADFACGSGTLLMAAYDRKAELAGKNFDEKAHIRFVEHDLTGTDIMPFAAHLAAVQLALRNPGYLTDRVRIAVTDSTALRPGSKIQPLQRVMPRGQSAIHHFHEEEIEKRRVRAGAVSGAGAGKGFEARGVDVVIMNPPFTRKQHVTKDHRQMLSRLFQDYGEYASNEQNLSVYFVLLADRFLKEGGRMAMVLPTSFIRQKSAEGARRLLREKYEIEFIIQSGYRSAFSESTSFREILLVVRKLGRAGASKPCLVGQLEVMPTEGNVPGLAKLLIDARKGDSITDDIAGRAEIAKLKLGLVSQQSLRSSDNWPSLLPAEGLEGIDLPESPCLAPLAQVADGVVQGIRFEGSSDRVNVKNTIISQERNAQVQMNWKIVADTKAAYDATSLESGAKVRIPKTALRPTTRSPAGMETIEIVEPPDYIVISRFRDDKEFWDDGDPDKILELRIPHLESREAMLVAAGRNNVNLAAGGTHLLAFVSPKPIPPTWSFWSIKVRTVEDAKLLGLWWNSTFHLAQLFARRSEVEGSWMGWLKEDLLPMTVIKPSALAPDDRKTLLAVYEKWKQVPFPPLLAQLEGSFEGRVAIDNAIGATIGIQFSAEQLQALYQSLTQRVGALSKMMGRD